MEGCNVKGVAMIKKGGCTVKGGIYMKGDFDLKGGAAK